MRGGGALGIMLRSTAQSISRFEKKLECGEREGKKFIRIHILKRRRRNQGAGLSAFPLFAERTNDLGIQKGRCVWGGGGGAPAPQRAYVTYHITSDIAVAYIAQCLICDRDDDQRTTPIEGIVIKI